jgi:hypothetical protein
MFESYSTRAVQVIFLARLEAGARGAELLDLDDLLAGLIIEDQNKIPAALARLGRGGELMVLAKHQSFLPPDAAAHVLESIQQLLPRSQFIPESADMPISSGLAETLAAATDLGKTLQTKEVTPLHLLAVLMRGSHKGVQALREAGIIEEEVVKVIRQEDQG